MLELRTERLVLRPMTEDVAKVPGVRHVGGELYELTLAALGSQV